jgi:outer membrane protein assembly factor BamB
VAVDARTGQELWSFNLGTPQSGGIISFAVDGKQYIAVAAGGTLRSQVWFSDDDIRAIVRYVKQLPTDAAR